MKKNWSTTIHYIFFLSLTMLYLCMLNCNSVKNRAEDMDPVSGSDFSEKRDINSDGNADKIILHASEGGKIGMYIDSQMDLQADELKSALSDVQVKRIAEGIIITFEAEDLFSADSYDMSTMVENKLLPLAAILDKYKDTYILIEGHSDKFASEEYNLQLSRKRANTILKYLSSNYIDSERITAIGYAENSNVNGQTSKPNNRIDIAIYANEKMKKLAKKERN